MNFFKIVLFLIFSMDAMAVVFKCGSNDKSRLAVEINDPGANSILTFSALQGNAPLVIKTEGAKAISGLNYQFIFNPQGNQATLKEERSAGKLFSNRSGLKFNCKSSPKETFCKSTDGKMAFTVKGPIMEITDRIGRPDQSVVRADAMTTYKTNLGMEVAMQPGGKGIYSGSKKKGAIVDAKAINLICK